MSEFLGMSTNTWQHLSRTDHGFIFQSRVNVLVKSTSGHELLTCQSLYKSNLVYMYKDYNKPGFLFSHIVKAN